MLKSINPTQTPAWKELSLHAEDMKKTHLRQLFTADEICDNKTQATRFAQYSLNFNDDILLDYSKNIINNKTLALLLSLAEQCELPQAIVQLFSGENINQTENRAVLHTALRNRGQRPVFADGQDIMPEIHRVLEQMRVFTNQITTGVWRGYTGKPIRDIVNIGIGGSDLGPYMATEALKAYHLSNISVHFVSNIDGSHIVETLKKLKAETTLFLIASKTFTTQETITNAQTARTWFLEQAIEPQNIRQHFVAISANAKAVSEFGIDAANRFEFWDWVGGRYSLCSAIGLSVACSIGYENFEKMLEGAYDMDLHFAETPLASNIPVILALLSIWYGNFFAADTEAILAYDQYLHRFVPYIQQCSMESNGKSVDRSGKKINYQTGAIVWGEPGTNGQHAFYQLLHQGTKIIPCDFLVAANSQNNLREHHTKLLANFFAQTEALAFGNVNEKNREIEPFKLFDGNHPSNSLIYKKLTPYVLGSLISMYEHKVFTQGIIWNIFSFDQWGVELGKRLANAILPQLDTSEVITNHDSSTNGLINAYKRMRHQDFS